METHAEALLPVTPRSTPGGIRPRIGAGGAETRRRPRKANGELLTRTDYGYHIGYVWILLDWSRDSDRSSWFEHPSIELPRLNARVRDRLGWLPHRVAGELRHIWHALKKSEDEDG